MNKTVAGFYRNSGGKSAVVRAQILPRNGQIKQMSPVGQGAGALFCRKKMSEQSELLFPEEKSTRPLASHQKAD